MLCVPESTKSLALAPEFTDKNPAYTGPNSYLAALGT